MGLIRIESDFSQLNRGGGVVSECGLVCEEWRDGTVRQGAGGITFQSGIRAEFKGLYDQSGQCERGEECVAATAGELQCDTDDRVLSERLL